MDQPNVFREFSKKVKTVLTSPDPQVILDALRALAEGKEANLQDGRVIEPLGPWESSPETFPNQLRWGRKRLRSESANEPNLWETLALFDGPEGYNQSLVDLPKIAYSDLVARLDQPPPRVVTHIGGVSLPKVLGPSQSQPVQSLDEDLPYISDFLRGNGTARAVAATRCKFGWERLSVDCLCLYVDADDTTSLENSVTSLADLAMIRESKLCHTGDSLSEAQKLLAPTGITELALKERMYDLRQNRIRRVVRQDGNIYPGQSISLMGEESKGSVGVFLSPCGVDEHKVYALTAHHAVPFKIAGQRVITPGGLDILTQLQRAVDSHPKDIEVLLKRRNEACGYAEYGHIGSNQQGWGSDFTLIHLDDHWIGENDELYDVDLSVLHNPGDIVYQDGATTGGTVGQIGSSEVLLFERGTASDVVRAKFLAILPLDVPFRDDVCAKGDSGSGVFLPAPQEDGWKFAGQLVSMIDMDGWAGLMIPQSQVFQTLKEKTGKAWRLSG
ncbi:uncharacterized protein TRUGW13939_05134 [Talaromyces rugulosus]|uniref:Uncharacterized protein n=1 Tax=Talaromyces rugulosus TaxID=121627 RepID=A0A7H8QVH4_TALRU|nr:uncharacterized protein TRUGW13939_05134 [Talaromyces rugulosus]QKX58014.1 hypothetical protein TRUGW13939_05134 [Talaromyces rugulosus]